MIEYFENVFQHRQAQSGQDLEYDLGGKPLLYSGLKDDVAKNFWHNLKHSRPSFNPSSERRFGLQLMPKAIMDLEDLI